MRVAEPAITARKTNAARRRKRDVGENFGVVVSGKRSQSQHPVGRATMRLRELRKSHLGSKASAKNKIVRH